LLPFEDDDLQAAAWLSAQDLALQDPELAAVRQHIKTRDPAGQRVAAVLRDTIDQLLNGELTGRYDWKDLYKTEKTHAGTVVEINLQREFKFTDGDKMDYEIVGFDVDCKFSQNFGHWMIPPEALDHLCLVVWANDSKSLWSAGLIRIRSEWLNSSKNRDSKKTIAEQHRNKIAWLWYQEELPENTLLHIDPADCKAIVTPTSGQARVNELFRRVQKRRIRRNVVRTVAQQKDYMKRVRENGGARSALQPEGILVMGDYASHQKTASALGVPIPQEGEFVSARVIRAREEHAASPQAELDGVMWVLAGKDDPCEPGPQLPKHTR
jgi:phage gpG-like protein